MLKKNQRRLIGRFALYSVLACASVYVYFNFYLVEEEHTKDGIEGLKKDNFYLQYKSNRSAGIQPKKFLDMVEQSMRITPDLRLVDALLNLRNNLDPSLAVSYASIKRESDGWSIVGNGTNFRIPSDMGPDEFYELSGKMMSKWDNQRKFTLEVKKQSPELNSLSEEVNSFEYPRILKALQRLNELYKASPDLNTFQIISKATIILALHSTEYFLDNRKLESKALALFTILKNYKMTGIEEEEALIAYMLGYKTYLDKSILRLGNKAGGFRYILSQDRDGFKDYINEKRRPLRDVFLFVQELGKSVGADSIIEYEVDSILKMYGNKVIPAISKMLLKKSTFNLGYRLTLAHINYLQQTIDGKLSWSENLKYNLNELQFFVYQKLLTVLPKSMTTLGAFLNEKILLTMRPSYLVNKVEKFIDYSKPNYKGMLFDDIEYQYFYYGITYNLVAKMGNQFVKVLGSKERTTQFISELNDFDSVYAKLYQRYLQAAFDGIFGNPKNYQLVDDLCKYHDLALYRLYDLYEIYNNKLGYWNPQLPVISLMINRKLDSRPAFNDFAFSLNHSIIYNIKNSHDLLKRQYRFDPTGQPLTKYNLKFMDFGEVAKTELLEDKSLSFDQKFYFLKRFKDLFKEDWKAIVSEKIERDKQDYYALKELVEILESEKKYEEARDMLIVHAPYFDSSNDLTYANVMALAAKMSLLMGLPEQADTDVAPVYQSYSGYGLQLKAEVLSRLGKHSEAASVIKKAIKRYPQAYFYEYLAEYLLMQNMDQEVIDLLHKEYVPEKNNISFPLLGEVLNRVSEKRNGFDIGIFLDSLLKDERFLLRLPDVMSAFSKVEKHDIALEMIKKYFPKNLKFNPSTLNYRYTDNWELFTREEKVINYLIYSYSRFSDAKKFKEGAKFVFDNAGKESIPYLFFGSLDSEAETKFELFKLITEKNDINSQFAALCYTLDFITGKSQDLIAKNALNEFFSDTNIKTFYYKMGQFLLSGIGYDEVIELAIKEGRQISLYYFMARYYDSKNDLIEANRWYQAGVFEGTYSYESSWIRNEMKKLQQSFRSIPGVLRTRKKNLEDKAIVEGRDYGPEILEVEKQISLLNQ